MDGPEGKDVRMTMLAVGVTIGEAFLRRKIRLFLLS
jgi:hypothetical protein